MVAAEFPADNPLPRAAPGQRRVTWSFAVGLFLLAGMMAFFVVEGVRVLASDRWVEHTHGVIRLIEHVLFDVQAAESSQRGYTASGQETYLPPYEAAIANLPKQLAALRDATEDNPVQQRNVAELKAAIDLKLALMRQRFDERRALGAGALDAKYLNGSGRRAMENVLAIGHQMIELETGLLRQRADARAAGLRASVGVLCAAGLMGAGLLAASFWFVRRELRRSRELGGAVAQANGGLEREVAERRRTQQRLSAQNAVAHVAAESPSLPGAAPGFLQQICEHLGWEVGECWTVEPATGRMRLVAYWHGRGRSAEHTAQIAGFVVAGQRQTFARGEGLPGQVWAGGRAVWECDFLGRTDLPRAGEARDAGLRRAFAFPLHGAGHGQITGVMMFLSTERGAPDGELIDTMDTLAGQIAQFAERCGAEAGLRASQARFTAFMANAPAVAYIKDPEGRMLYGNETLLRTFHLQAGQWLGKTDADLWPDAAPAIRENDLAVLAGDRATELNEAVRLPDGRMSHWLSYKFPLFDEATGTKLLAGMSVDITAREEAQANRRAREEAERASRAKSEFLSRVSHELRTPLNAILGFGQLLQTSQRSEQDAESLEYMLKAGRHLLGLVDELLDVSRAESGELQLTRSQVDPREAARECLHLTARLAQEGEVACELEGFEDGVALWCDAQRLRQILLNLISNAIKYNRRGGSVTVRYEHGAEGRTLRLGVSDTGPGIAPEAVRKLFMPFERLEQKGGKVEGIGLGLVVCRRLAEAMGGSVSVESEVGRGSVFWLELPTEGGGAAAEEIEIAVEVDAEFLAAMALQD